MLVLRNILLLVLPIYRVLPLLFISLLKDTFFISISGIPMQFFILLLFHVLRS
jgi:hypothetical protein